MDTPNRWSDIIGRLGEWFTEIASSPGEPYLLDSQAGTWDSLVRFYFPEEQASRKEIEEYLRGIFSGDRIPTLWKLSSRGKYFLCARIECALDFSGMAFPPQSSESPFGDLPQDWSDSKVIEWLLVDLWDRRYDHWLKICAIQLYGPFPLYGIEPADPNVPS